MRREAIIDVKNGKLSKECNEDVVILKGQFLNEDSNFAECLKIIIKSSDGNDDNEFTINVGGYNFKLFTGKFSSEKKDDILIYGETGGSGGYAIAIVYKYEDGELEEIFNGDNFSEKYKWSGKYLDCYRIEVICSALERKYTLDISNIDKRYLREIYNIDGKIITNDDPSISYVNSIKVINDLEGKLLSLECCERIIGVNNSNTLGEIKTLISLEDEKVNILSQCAATKGESVSEFHRATNKKSEIARQLPEDAVFINLNKFGGNNGVIISDIDGDGVNEIICGYKSKDNQYLAIFRDIDNCIKYVDTISGEGYDISDFIITPLRGKNTNSILIGWRIGAIWSVLDILELQNGKLNKVLKGDKINYSKVEIIENDSKRGVSRDIALWTHETGEAYKVQLYTLRGDVLQKSIRISKEYFETVEKYYRDLIDRTRETPQYLYYLIDAQIKCGKRKEAIENINKALKSSKPYPSVEELRRIKKRL